MSSRQFTSFNQFWCYYVQEHSGQATRVVHFLGTTSGLGLAVAAIVCQKWLWLLAAVVLGYGLAWLSHLVFERNRPATLQHPLWSLLADLRMWWLMLGGRMEREVQAVLDERPDARGRDG